MADANVSSPSKGLTQSIERLRNGWIDIERLDPTNTEFEAYISEAARLIKDGKLTFEAVYRPGTLRGLTPEVLAEHGVAVPADCGIEKLTVSALAAEFMRSLKPEEPAPAASAEPGRRKTLAEMALAGELDQAQTSSFGTLLFNPKAAQSRTQAVVARKKFFNAPTFTDPSVELAIGYQVGTIVEVLNAGNVELFATRRLPPYLESFIALVTRHDAELGKTAFFRGYAFVPYTEHAKFTDNELQNRKDEVPGFGEIGGLLVQVGNVPGKRVAVKPHSTLYTLQSFLTEERASIQLLDDKGKVRKSCKFIMFPRSPYLEMFVAERQVQQDGTTTATGRLVTIGKHNVFWVKGREIGKLHLEKLDLLADQEAQKTGGKVLETEKERTMFLAEVPV